MTLVRHGRRNLPLAVCYWLVLQIVLGCVGLSDEEHGTVDRWLLCDECTNGELAAVVALGTRAISRLEDGLLNGPPADRRTLMRTKLEQRYQSLVPAPVISQADYVNELLSNYVAMYHRRSATALGEIGGDRARDALDRALDPAHSNQYRLDVAREIRFIRKTMDAAPFSGVVTPSEVAVGDTIRVDASQAEPFTGDEVASFEEAAFAPNDVLIGSVQAQGLRFLAAGPIGRHALAISNVGATQDTQVAAVSIASTVDANDRATLGCESYACAASAAPIIVPPILPYTSVLTLRRSLSRPDTIDVFRVENSSGGLLPITAHLSWPATVNANLDLRWTNCAAPSVVGNTAGATLANPELTSVSLPLGACWLLAVLMPSGGNELVFARLRVTTP